MFQTRKGKLAYLEATVGIMASAKPLTAAGEIAQLENIIPAEMAALLMLTNLFKQPMTWERVGPGPQRGPKSFEQRRQEALCLQARRLQLMDRVKELRELVPDDDDAWRARSARLQAECDGMTGRTGP